MSRLDEATLTHMRWLCEAIEDFEQDPELLDCLHHYCATWDEERILLCAIHDAEIRIEFYGHPTQEEYESLCRELWPDTYPAQ